LRQSLSTLAGIPPGNRMSRLHPAGSRADGPALTLREPGLQQLEATASVCSGRSTFGCRATALKGGRTAGFPADRPHVTLKATFSQVRAILGNALRSRVRRFESCWGRRGHRRAVRRRAAALSQLHLQPVREYRAGRDHAEVAAGLAAPGWRCTRWPGASSTARSPPRCCSCSPGGCPAGRCPPPVAHSPSRRRALVYLRTVVLQRLAAPLDQLTAGGCSAWQLTGSPPGAWAAEECAGRPSGRGERRWPGLPTPGRLAAGP